MPVKVSVVVPVYNPGEFIDPLITSLQHQTLPQDEFEVVFVDDGSTDQTPAKLDRLAEEHDNVTVVHIPNSGWPGRPRNVGVDTARGKYVQFVDHDDELGTEALERLWNYAEENGSDVVVGKEVRRTGGWSVLNRLFEKNRPDASLATDPLLGIMTPHKMFRREFLNEHDIRFFEGPRRMEDHPFVIEAYFCASVISVLSDYTVYYWNRRPDVGNAGARPYDWASYYGYLRDVLDIIERHTEPGPFRDRLFAFYYEAKGLGILTRSVSHKSRDLLLEHFQALHDLAAERYPLSVDDAMQGVIKARSALVRAGDFEGFLRLARLEAGLRLHQELLEVSAADGVLTLRMHVALQDPDGAPLRFEPRDGRWFWQPPAPLGDAVPPGGLDVTGPFTRKRVEVVLRNRRTAESFLVRAEIDAPLPAPGRAAAFDFDVTARIDPESVSFGRPLTAAVWDAFVRLTCLPWRPRARLKGFGAAEPLSISGAVLRTRRTVTPFTTPSGNLAIDVQQSRLSLLDAGLEKPVGGRLERTPEGLRLHVPLRGLRLRGRRIPGRLELLPEEGGPARRSRLVLAPRRGGHAVLRSLLPPLEPGRWRLVARTQGQRAELGLTLEARRLGGPVLFDQDGTVLADGGPPGRAAATAANARRVAGAVRRRVVAKTSSRSGRSGKSSKESA